MSIRVFAAPTKKRIMVALDSGNKLLVLVVWASLNGAEKEIICMSSVISDNDDPDKLADDCGFDAQIVLACVKFTTTNMAAFWETPDLLVLNDSERVQNIGMLILQALHALKLPENHPIYVIYRDEIIGQLTLLHGVYM